MQELQRRMTAREFQEWQEYYKQEPFGDDWMQAAIIAATQVNLWSKRKVKPEQFIPRSRVRHDPKALEAKLMHYAACHNAAVEKRESRPSAALRQPASLSACPPCTPPQRRTHESRRQRR